MPFATGARGARIYYETRGTAGPPAILIQGLGLSSRFWFDLPDRLATGRDPWRVLTPDHRGVGRSDRPLGPYGMRTMADDVAGVLDHAGLVLLATTAGFPHVRLPRLSALAYFLGLPLTGRLNRDPIDPAFARLLLSRKDVPRAGELLSGWPAALKTEPTSLRVFAAHFAAVLGHATGAALRQVACPTVIVSGDDDALLPAQNSRVLARLIPGAHLEIVPGGHILPANDPECVRRALDRARDMSDYEPAPVAAGLADRTA